MVDSPEEAVAAAEAILTAPLVTAQTGPGGGAVNELLVEEGVAIDREYYLSMTVDRTAAAPIIIFSRAGGMDIEEVASSSPELIHKEHIDPAVGWMPYQGRNLVYALEPRPSPETLGALMEVMASVVDIFFHYDCSLIEINPLVVTVNGGVTALDAKITIDNNAVFRQEELRSIYDPREKDPLERTAQDCGLNYIRLNGTIGAMVNGAGLAMATMDVIKLAGAEPANFLDVGGGANEEMITKAFEIILMDGRVRAILINIFGGILRCDVLARGVVAAARRTAVTVPLIVRLEGTNVEEGREILRSSGLEFLVARDIGEAAELVASQVA